MKRPTHYFCLLAVFAVLLSTVCIASSDMTEDGRAGSARSSAEKSAFVFGEVLTLHRAVPDSGEQMPALSFTAEGNGHYRLAVPPETKVVSACFSEDGGMLCCTDLQFSAGGDEPEETACITVPDGAAQVKLFFVDKDCVPVDSAIELKRCEHEDLLLEGPGDASYLLCRDCGMRGTEASVTVTKNPTASAEGEALYRYRYKDKDYTISRAIPKLTGANWTWAFCNDYDRDGIPEMMPTTFRGTTSYTYRYKMLESDIEGYPDWQEYGYPSDEEYDEVCSADEYYYDLWLEAMNTYGENSPEAIAAAEEYDRIVTPMWDAIAAKEEAAEAEFQKALAAFRETHDTSMVGSFSPQKTFTLVEDGTLCYWLHIPFDYDPDRSYPIVAFVPGEGGSFSNYVDANGNVKGTNVIPYGADWCGSFFSNWYAQVKDPGEGRDRYDCFMITIYPTNKFFRGESLAGRGTAVGIVNMYGVNNVDDAFTYTAEMTGNSAYKATYKSSYDASLLDPAKDAQLLLQLIDSLMEEYSIDAARQYVLGASLGGIFTMDIISHYPERFAAAVPCVSAAADISEKNAKNLTGMNIWAIGGSGDGTCSKYHAKLFVEAINAAREKYDPDSTNVAQYSFFPGGHSCAYLGGTARKADEGVSITYAAQVLDFMFSSSRAADRTEEAG